MNLIDRHIFSEWLKTFSLVLGVTLGLLLLEDMYDDLEDLLDFGVGLQDIAKYYLVLIPSFLPTVLPLSLMISILFSLGTLHRNHEIIALRACGLSLARITRALWVVGMLFALLLFYLNARLVPWSVEQSRTLRQNFAFAHQMKERSKDDIGLIYNLTFYNHKDLRLWFMNRFSEYTYRAYGLTVSLLDSSRREATRLMANEGYFDDVEGHWVFLNGREITFDTVANEPIRSLSFEQKNMTDFNEDPTLMKSLEKRPKDLSFPELQRILDKLSAAEDPRVHGYAVRYHSILVNPFSALIIVGLAVPFAVTGVRVNPLVGVSKSFGLFFAYYLVASLSFLMGERSILNPILAAWVPFLLIVIVALLFYRRAL